MIDRRKIDEVYADCEPDLNSIQETIQSAGLSLEEERAIVVLVASHIFGWGIGVTDEINGISRRSPEDIAGSPMRRFADFVIRCIEANTFAPDLHS